MFFSSNINATIIDNDNQGFSTTGTWKISSFTPGFYGSNYRYASTGSGTAKASWQFDITVAGSYDISARWTSMDAPWRATNAKYKIENNGTPLATITVDQTVNGGTFSSLGHYTLSAGTLTVTLSNDANNDYVIADAVQIEHIATNSPPNGTIVEPSIPIQIHAGEPVSFIAAGSDPDNDNPLTYTWTFGDPGIPNSTAQSPSGVVFLTVGTYTVSLTVTDPHGLSDPSPATVVVEVIPPINDIADVIVDNTDSAFEYTGTWGTSTHTAGYYGSNYHYASTGNGSARASWFYNISTAGSYEIAARWTSMDAPWRATNAPYRIYNNGTLVAIVPQDQTSAGGQFNTLGTFQLAAGTLTVTLSNNANNQYVVADATRLHFVDNGDSSSDEVIPPANNPGAPEPIPYLSEINTSGYLPGDLSVSQNGAATYSIPISLVPGTSGMTPELAFSYNSQAGVSILGLGWSIDGLSTITRCGRTIAQDGQNVGVDFTDGDQFCIDGQRLIAVSGEYGQPGTEYRTEVDAFARITSYGRQGAGPAYFVVETKSGQTIEYGATNDSRIEAQGRAEVYTWAQNRVTDSVGNYIVINYGEDNANTDYWVSRIDYTGNEGAGLLPYASVVFTYDTNAETRPFYVGGSKFSSTKRLTGLSVVHDGSTVTEYQFDFNVDTDKPAKLTSLRQCDGNGNCLPPTVFEWSTVSENALFSNAQVWQQNGYPLQSSGQGSAYDTPSPHLLGDLNGDGYLDILAAGDQLQIFISTGSGFQSGGLAPHCYGPVGLGDVNGDGRDDLICAERNTVKVALETSNGFTTYATWLSSGFPAHGNNIISPSAVP